jgi:nitrite reductase/ring-hydroxylating ferredoxin subunit
MGDPDARECLVGASASVVVLREGERVTAYLNRCPHFQIPLNSRPDHFLMAGRGLLMCAYHAAVFRFSDGACTEAPCAGSHLTPIAVRLEGHSVVAI